MLLTTMVKFKKDTKQEITVLYFTTIDGAQNTKIDFQNFSFFVFCNFENEQQLADACAGSPQYECPVCSKPYRF